MRGSALPLLGVLVLTAAAAPAAAETYRCDSGSIRYRQTVCPDATSSVPRQPVSRPPSGVTGDGGAIRNVWRTLRAERQEHDTRRAAAAAQRLDSALRRQRGLAREPDRPQLTPRRRPDQPYRFDRTPLQGHD